MTTHTESDYTVTYDDSPEAKQAIYECLLKWFLKTGMFNGEQLQKCDVTTVDAPDLLSEIAETHFKFDSRWTEQAEP